MAVFGVSSQLFHIYFTYDSPHTKGVPWNSLMKAAQKYRQILKLTHPSSPLTRHKDRFRNRFENMINFNCL